MFPTILHDAGAEKHTPTGSSHTNLSPLLFVSAPAIRTGLTGHSLALTCSSSLCQMLVPRRAHGGSCLVARLVCTPTCSRAMAICYRPKAGPQCPGRFFFSFKAVSGRFWTLRYTLYAPPRPWSSLWGSTYEPCAAAQLALPKPYIHMFVCLSMIYPDSLRLLASFC